MAIGHKILHTAPKFTFFIAKRFPGVKMISTHLNDRKFGLIFQIELII